MGTSSASMANRRALCSVSSRIAPTAGEPAEAMSFSATTPCLIRTSPASWPNWRTIPSRTGFSSAPIASSPYFERSRAEIAASAPEPSRIRRARGPPFSIARSASSPDCTKTAWTLVVSFSTPSSATSFEKRRMSCSASSLATVTEPCAHRLLWLKTSATTSIGRMCRALKLRC